MERDDYSFTLMRIVTLDAAGNEMTRSDITPDGKRVTHKDQLSEYLYNAMRPLFMNRMSQKVGALLIAKIEENWQHHIDNPTPIWTELVVNKPGITRYGVDTGIDKLVFGIGTFFHVGSPTEHFALRDFAASDAKIQTMKETVTFRIITDPQGNLHAFALLRE